MSYSSLTVVGCFGALSVLFVGCGGSDSQRSSHANGGDAAQDGGSGGEGNAHSSSTNGGDSGQDGGSGGKGNAHSSNTNGGASGNGSTPSSAAGTSSGALGYVETVTGSSDSSGSSDGVGRFGSLQEPMDIATDGTKMYLVEGTGGNRVRVYDPATGVISTLAGDGKEGFRDGTGTAASFHDLQALVIDPSYRFLYVADSYNCAIRKVEIATGKVTTIAGAALDTDRPDCGSSDGIGSAARFSAPDDLVIDSTGTHLYIADSGNHEIRAIDLKSNEVTTFVGSMTAGNTNGIGSAAAFSSPVGIAIDSKDSKLYIADRRNDNIRIVNIESKAVTSIPAFSEYDEAHGNTSNVSLFGLRGLAVDSTGDVLYVTQIQSDVVRRLELTTNTSTILAGSLTNDGFANGIGSAAWFDFPEGVLATGNDLYVADSTNKQIRKIDLTTKEVTTFLGSNVAASFSGPRSVTSDGTYLYVTDAHSGQIRKVSIATGNTTTIVAKASDSNETATFEEPCGITSDNANLYIVDGGNNVVLKLVLSTGKVSVLAGIKATSGAANGVGVAATFNEPQGIAIDRKGKNLYVADQANHMIRKIVIANGEVTTLAGSTQSGLVNGVGAAARFNMPANLAIDPSDRYLYVSDGENNVIRKIDLASAEVSILAGSRGKFNGRQDGSGDVATFDKPWGIATDGSYVYVADAGNNMIRRIELATTTVQTISGSYTTGSDDGPGAEATFGRPEGLMLDATGTYLYVCDDLNNEIRRVTVK